MSVCFCNGKIHAPHSRPTEDQMIYGEGGPITDTTPTTRRRRIADQPPPVPNARPAVWDLVIGDMIQRDGVGRERYGTPLQPHNGRDALVDAYEEALDLVVYLRQAIYERDNPL